MVVRKAFFLGVFLGVFLAKKHPILKNWCFFLGVFFLYRKINKILRFPNWVFFLKKYLKKTPVLQAGFLGVFLILFSKMGVFFLGVFFGRFLGVFFEKKKKRLPDYH